MMNDTDNKEMKETESEKEERRIRQLSDEELNNVTGGCGEAEMPSDYTIGSSPKFAIGDAVATGDWNQATLKEGTVIGIDSKPTKYKSKDKGLTYIYHCDLYDDEGWIYHDIKVPEYKLRRR